MGVANVGDEAAVEAAVVRVLDILGRTDILVNNATVWDVADLLDIDLPT
jgi:NAD(P)-dependent dehydrogenase (short-subunit alcohol dehydrogenase family)